jgi:hypothetical protein
MVPLWSHVAGVTAPLQLSPRIGGAVGAGVLGVPACPAELHAVTNTAANTNRAETDLTYTSMVPPYLATAPATESAAPELPIGHRADAQWGP